MPESSSIKKPRDTILVVKDNFADLPESRYQRSVITIKPREPAIASIDIIMFTPPWSEYPSNPSENKENPAVQNAETLWKIENHARFQKCEIESPKAMNKPIAPNISIANVKITTLLIKSVMAIDFGRVNSVPMTLLCHLVILLVVKSKK